MANSGSCVGPQNKIGHLAPCRFPRWVPVEHKTGSKSCLIVFLGLRYEIVDRIWVAVWKKKKKKEEEEEKREKIRGVMTREMNDLEINWSLFSALM